MTQRIIKFRAWDGSRMINDWLVVRQDPTGKAVQNAYSHAIEVMQFTGLLDKNGKEIYEGDLLSYMGNEPQEVIFHKGTFCHKVSDGLYHIFGESDWEIIGNIYENKELLK